MESGGVRLQNVYPKLGGLSGAAWVFLIAQVNGGQNQHKLAWGSGSRAGCRGQCWGKAGSGKVVAGSRVGIAASG